ncbi:MAG: hypothetical protein EA387_08780 [Nitriliruptor sp.]|nr:MAG: hypothetical protein EA387_08780 [Nitriliruptor sp.]
MADHPAPRLTSGDAAVFGLGARLGTGTFTAIGPTATVAGATVGGAAVARATLTGAVVLEAGSVAGELSLRLRMGQRH